MGMGLEAICTQNYVVPCFFKGLRRSLIVDEGDRKD